jgi:hypothetical protein
LVKNGFARKPGPDLSMEADIKENDMNVKPVFGLALLGLAATLSLATPSEAAMPAGPQGLAQPAVTLAAGGCGIGWHRGPLGGCVRNGPVVVVPAAPVVVAPAVVVRPPVVVAPRVCPFGFHLGPAGRRCVPN